MPSGKLSVTIGGVTFRGEGDQNWLSAQLEKVLAVASTLVHAEPLSDAAPPAGSNGANGSHSGAPGDTATASHAASSSNGVHTEPAGHAGEKFTTALATYIREKGGDASQVDRFLIVADWLRQRGESKLTTALISKTLVDNHQKRLANPSDCLSKNLSKGLCEKTENGFYITPEGLKKLGSG